MNLMTWSTICIMFSGKRGKLRRAKQLIAKKEKAWAAYQKAREDLHALMGLHV